MLREAGFGGAALSAGTQTVNNGTVIFSNQNGVTFGLSTAANGSATLTATVNPGPAAGIGGNIAGTQTQTSGSLSFANSNNISFGLSNSSVLTASFQQSVQTQASGNIAGVGSTFNGANISGSITLNSAGLNLSISGPVESGIGVSANGSSQGAGTIIFSNSNGVSFGMNGSTITASAAGGGAAFSGGVSTGGNTLGNTGTQTGQLVLVGGNNITLSVSSAAGGAQSITISGPNAGGAQTGISGVIVSNTTYTSGTVSFSNANGISFGSSAGQAITASYTVPTQTNQTIGAYAVSQSTGASSSSTIDARSLSFAGYGVVSVGFSGGTVQISAPGTTGLTQLSAGISTGGNTAGNTGLASAQLVLAGGNNITLSGSTNGGSMTVTISGGAGGGAAQSFGVSTGGNTAGNTGIYSGQVVFAGSNNITLSVSSGAAGAQTITVSGPNAQTGISGIIVSNTTYTSGTVSFSNANGISFGSSAGQAITASYTVPTQTNQTVGLYGVGNTTQNSSTTLDARTVSFDGLGAMTVGFSNGSVQLSAPATSSISGTGQISVQVNGSTISIGAPSYGTLSYWDNDISQGSAGASQFGLGSVLVQPISMGGNLSLSAFRQFVSGSFSSSSNSSYAGTLTVRVGIYTLNGSSLSQASSGSQTYAFTNTSNNSTASLSGIRGVSIPINASMTPGNYWLALWSSTASANANWFTLSNVVQSQGAAVLSGAFGAAATATAQQALGYGVWSTTSTNLPASIGLSHITGSAVNNAAFLNLYNVSA